MPELVEIHQHHEQTWFFHRLEKALDSSCRSVVRIHFKVATCFKFQDVKVSVDFTQFFYLFTQFGLFWVAVSRDKAGFTMGMGTNNKQKTME